MELTRGRVTGLIKCTENNGLDLKLDDPESKRDFNSFISIKSTEINWSVWTEVEFLGYVPKRLINLIDIDLYCNFGILKFLIK